MQSGSTNSIMKKTFISLALIVGFVYTVMSQNSTESLPTHIIRKGLPFTFEKLKAGKNVTIVYLGGSITNHEGYRVYTTDWFKSQFPTSKITSINAGIGGTGSDLGVFRMKNDVLQYKPDLVFVEFAVNDANTDSLIICNAMEGIVRKIKKNNPKTEVCFLYTINKPMLQDMTQNRLFRSMRIMEVIASHYNIPSINFGVDIVKLLKNDRLIFQGEKGKEYDGKIVFTNDGTHPTINQGHKLYAETFIAAIQNISTKTGKSSLKIPKPLFDGFFEKSDTFSPLQFSKSAGWQPIPETHLFYKTNKTRCPDLILTTSPNDSITLKFKGKYMGVYDIIGPNSVGFTVSVDGKKPFTVQRFDKYATYYRNSYTLLPVMSDNIHTITIKMSTQPIDKLKILSTKTDNVIDENIQNQLKDNVLYIGNFLISGKIFK